MTGADVKKAAVRVAEAMGRGWRASDGETPLHYRILNGEETVRKRCRIEYGGDDFAYIAFQGGSWLEALDSFFEDTRIKATAWQHDILKKLGGASSAEELILKTAVSEETA